MHCPTDQFVAAYHTIVDKFGFSRRIQPGTIQVLDWDLQYVCGSALAGFIDSILIRRLNDFIPDHDCPLIIDCGANIGFSVLNYKRQFPQARIIALEPDPQIAPVLRRNLLVNNAADVEVVEAAAWTSDEQVPWYCEGVDGSHIVEFPGPSADTVEVRAVDLARYLSQPVDLLKLDIEGAEYLVVPHLKEVLQNVKCINIECHLNQSNLTRLGDVLKTLGDCRFKVSLNSYGKWRDLVRQPHLGGDAWEQYLLVAGWRGPLPYACSEASIVPYVGIQRELELETARNHSLSFLESILAPLRALAVGKSSSVICRAITPPFQKEGSNGWSTVLQDLQYFADTAEDSRHSSLLLFENENLLGPPHSLHDDIRNIGMGRFSHWGGCLYFSPSDNTDPNSNGRRYSLVLGQFPGNNESC